MKKINKNPIFFTNEIENIKYRIKDVIHTRSSNSFNFNLCGDIMRITEFIKLIQSEVHWNIFKNKLSNIKKN